MKSKSEEKYLYRTETKITLETTIELNKVHKTLLKRLILIDIFGVIFGIFLTINKLNKEIDLFLLIICIMISVTIIDLIECVTFNKRLEIFHNNMKKKKFTDLEYEIFFFDDYLERVGEHNSTRIKYEDIEDVLEANSCLFIKIAPSMYITIIKNNCSKELIDFIKNIKPR